VYVALVEGGWRQGPTKFSFVVFHLPQAREFSDDHDLCRRNLSNDGNQWISCDSKSSPHSTKELSALFANAARMAQRPCKKGSPLSVDSEDIQVRRDRFMLDVIKE
jgi:hypothetical protein